jgi:hypothetical protein
MPPDNVHFRARNPPSVIGQGDVGRHESGPFVPIDERVIVDDVAGVGGGEGAEIRIVVGSEVFRAGEGRFEAGLIGKAV